MIVLSARTLESQKIAALDAGADDYVSKPFSAAELLARVRAGLRRGVRGGGETTKIRIGDVDVDLERREARRPSGDVHLTPLEFRLLESFVRHAGMIVRQAQLLREVWGPARDADTRSAARLHEEPAREARARSAQTALLLDRGRPGLPVPSRRARLLEISSLGLDHPGDEKRADPDPNGGRDADEHAFDTLLSLGEHVLRERRELVLAERIRNDSRDRRAKGSAAARATKALHSHVFVSNRERSQARRAPVAVSVVSRFQVSYTPLLPHCHRE